MTATKGAAVLRLPRDDDYIEAMLARFLRFAKRFIVAPHPGNPHNTRQ